MSQGMCTVNIDWQEINEPNTFKFINSLEVGYYIVKMKSVHERTRLKEVESYGVKRHVAYSETTTEINIRMMHITNIIKGKLGLIDGHFCHDYSSETFIAICKLEV